MIEQGVAGKVERAVQPQSGVILQAEPRRKMIEGLPHRQRRRGKNPCARLRRHPPLEQRGDIQRGLGQGKAASPGFKPAHLIRVGVFAGEQQQSLRQFFTASMATFQPLAAFGGFFQRLTQRIEDLDESGDRLLHQRLPCRFPPPRPPLRRAQRLAQGQHRLFHDFGPLPQDGKIGGVPRLLHHRIARQFNQLPASERLAKKEAGDLGQLVRFVENERINAGQQFRKAGLLHRHVGKQQMMVDDEHVSRQGLVSRLGEKAVVQMGAALPQTIIGGGSDAGPKRGGFRHGSDFGDVAAPGLAGPPPNAPQFGHLFPRTQPPFLLDGGQPVLAEVVAAALEQRRLHPAVQRPAHHR